MCVRERERERDRDRDRERESDFDNRLDYNRSIIPIKATFKYMCICVRETERQRESDFDSQLDYDRSIIPIKATFKYMCICVCVWEREREKEILTVGLIIIEALYRLRPLLSTCAYVWMYVGLCMRANVLVNNEYLSQLSTADNNCSFFFWLTNKNKVLII